jgi:TPR repeat protein
MINWSIVSTFFWVILEPICLSMFGTTLGKALFRLRLVSDNIEPNYWGRSVAVWLQGMGGGLPVISAFFMLNAAAKLKKNGQTEWDRRTGFSVEAEPLGILRSVSLTLLIVLVFVGSSILGEIGKHTKPSQQQIQQAQVVQSVPQATLSRKGMFDEFLPKTQVQNVPQDTPQLADDLFDQGLYAEALPLYQGLAEQGNTEAQISLGSMYENGQGVTQDYTQTISWYRKAADQGSSLGQFNLGIMYGTGRGVALNYVQAAYWYRKAADQGIVDAQYNLGWMYSTGRGVAEDYNQAVYWYRKAAEQGDANAQFRLGVMYEYGRGVAKDEVQAVVWYRKAAEQGNAEAQYNLGVMYVNGQGVAQNYNQAVIWFRKAAEQGNTNAIAALKKLGQ